MSAADVIPVDNPDHKYQPDVFLNADPAKVNHLGCDITPEGGTCGSVNRRTRIQTLRRAIVNGSCGGRYDAVGPFPQQTAEQLTAPWVSYHRQLEAFYVPPTPVIRAFLSPKNVKYVNEQVQQKLTVAADMRVYSPIDFEFVADMVDVAFKNSSLGFDAAALATLNRVIITRTVQQQFLSVRRKLLYRRLYIDQNRMRVFPHPEYSALEKNTTTISTSGRQLSHPFAQRQAEYLAFTSRRKSGCGDVRESASRDSTGSALEYDGLPA